MKYLIDIGSSTIKIVQTEGNYTEQIETKTFDFKDSFTEERGLSEEREKELIRYIKAVADNYGLTNRNTKLFATGVFRDIKNVKPFVERFFVSTGLYFNIISHSLEAFYLEKAWINKKTSSVKNLLIINIGGKTTELIVSHKGKIVGSPIKLKLGVKTVQEHFPKINNSYCGHTLSDVVDYVLDELSHSIEQPSHSVDTAIYTGGELTYMQEAKYSLKDNTLFSDSLHPSMIEINDYISRNSEVFSAVTIDELKSMHPSNPSWMEGARACSALAQAICQFFGVKSIIPSDTNLLDGVRIQEARTAVLCGSYNKYLDRIIQAKQHLEAKGISVLMPDDTEVAGYDGDFLLFKSNVIAYHSSWDEENKHLQAMKQCDMVVACNFDDYLGVTSTFELERAYRVYNKKIVFLEDTPITDSFGTRIELDIMPCEVGLL